MTSQNPQGSPPRSTSNIHQAAGNNANQFGQIHGNVTVNNNLGQQIRNRPVGVVILAIYHILAGLGLGIVGLFAGTSVVLNGMTRTADPGKAMLAMIYLTFLAAAFLMIGIGFWSLKRWSWILYFITIGIWLFVTFAVEDSVRLGEGNTIPLALGVAAALYLLLPKIRRAFGI